MPIYAYRCSSCGHAQDVLQRMSDPVLTTCPSCGGQTYAKQVTAAGFQLKGSGWYVTDFRGNGNAGAKKGDATEGAAVKDGAGDKSAEGGAAQPAADSAAAAPKSGSADATAPSPAAAPAAAPAPPAAK